jgi:hypothetical protein
MTCGLWSKNAEGSKIIIDSAINLEVRRADRITGIHAFLPLLMVQGAPVALRCQCDSAFCVGADNVMRNRAQEFHKWLARLSGIDADNHINVSDAKDLKRASSIKVCGEVVCGMGVVERIVPLQAATVEPCKHLGWTVEIRRHRLDCHSRQHKSDYDRPLEHDRELFVLG